MHGSGRQTKTAELFLCSVAAVLQRMSYIFSKLPESNWSHLYQVPTTITSENKLEQHKDYRGGEPVLLCPTRMTTKDLFGGLG